ncbi:hypothetical protein AAFF_G00079660 [Aldrovandia affinis]|uniref:Fork-head domain-containing protein n=1 Tax=Aldrovandia affinis TaxID=143900 RepID=A0AAD7WD37_9TELE|nr:hypothetical protein AAFF_G00079660 [Aldrovandia affinis]
MVRFFKCLWIYRNYLIIFLTPLLILPLPLVINTPEASCGFVIILMALYWCTECIPLAVTALLPVILFPMMGIMESSEVCVQYLKDSNMLFIGGLLVAIAVEYWNLHKRIALRVLLVVGVKPALLMMGFMGTTAFLSMWISNTASTAMMLPIAQAVLQQLSQTEADAQEREFGGLDNQAFQLTDSKESQTKTKETKETKEPNPDEEGGSTEAEERRLVREQKYLKLSKGMSLCVCYAASIGGTATLTGTTPNLILKGQVDELFPNNNGIINFASWFGFSFPNMLLMLIFSWLWLQFMFLGLNLKKSFGCGTKNSGEREAYQVMKDEYLRLGSISFAEGSVLVIFILLVVLWFTREPGFMPGWATVLFNMDKPYVTDGTVAILMSTLFFLLPSRMPSCSGHSEDEDGKWKAPPTLLNWEVVHEKMPWNIILLLGGGFALARGSETSGLSLWLGNSLAPLKEIPPFAISLLLCMLVGTFTECSSNTATTTLFLPILASMATAIKLHPLYVMLPCTICASLAFMLPVATPPNAIAFAYGNLKVMDMARAGFMLNVIGVLCINFALNTWGMAMFQLDTFPDWANITNGRSQIGCQHGPSLYGHVESCMGIRRFGWDPHLAPCPAAIVSAQPATCADPASRSHLGAAVACSTASVGPSFWNPSLSDTGSYTMSKEPLGPAHFPPRGSAAERYRRHSADGTTADMQEGAGLGMGHFHPYHRQYSDGGAPRQPPPYPLPRLHPPVCFQGMDLPEPLPDAHNHPDQECQQRAWDPYRQSVQPSTVRGAQLKYPGPSQIHNAYTSQQFPAGMFSTVGQSGYTFQCLTPQSPQDSTLHTLYPKPIYSYSILIFMALRSSQTGSLPVSEIYSFMTEHFPYFKTAPDGWKNSVRHNLSLNKCFEKVENRSGAGGGGGGGASRKGCLWALNPARVEKMQEELHKWRRKDPLAVRKSMARPEELGRLLGESTEGPRPVPAHLGRPTHSPAHPCSPAHLACPGPVLLTRAGLGFDPPSSFSPSWPGSPGYTFGHALQSPAPLPVPYPASGIPQEAGSLESPLPAQTPPYGEHCPRTMQELLTEGELCNDIDTLNPTLTDLQLHGNLWEELRDDSLAPDSLQLLPPSPPPAVPGPSRQNGYLYAAGEMGVSMLGDEGEGHLSNLHITGLYSTAFTHLEGVAGYLSTTGNTPITLL